MMTDQKTITIGQLATLCENWSYSAGSYVEPSIERESVSDELLELDWSDLPSLGLTELGSDDTIENGIHQEGISLYGFGDWAVFVYHNNSETNVQLCDKSGYDSLKCCAECWVSNCNIDDVPSIVLHQLGVETVKLEYENGTIEFESEQLSGTMDFVPFIIVDDHIEIIKCVEDYLQERLNCSEIIW